MKFVMHCGQFTAVDMGVYFSGTDVRMTEHFLYYPQIRTVGKQMGGKTVPQGDIGDKRVKELERLDLWSEIRSRIRPCQWVLT